MLRAGASGWDAATIGSTILDIQLLVPATHVVLPLALLAASLVIVRGVVLHEDARTVVWRLAAVVYGGLVVAATFFPMQIALGAYADLSPWWQRVNLDPFAGVHLRTFPLNILMTVPLGVLLASLTRWRWPVIVAAGLLVSLAIEVGQLLQSVLLGGSRAADVDDLIANTVGVAIGLVVLRILASSRAVRAVLPPRRSMRDRLVVAA